jgi:hypothetical protein
MTDTIAFNQGGQKFSSSFGCIVEQRGFDGGLWGVSYTSSNSLFSSMKTKKLFSICNVGALAVMSIGEIDSQLL